MFEIERKAGVFLQPEDLDLPYHCLYDFTFENRYHIFHERVKGGVNYICYDSQTKTSSAMCGRKAVVPADKYSHLIPEILYSIKYNGDGRFRGAAAYEPNQLIELIFRVIMPEYGYVIREPQIEMAKAIYKGLTTRQVTLCEAEVGTGKTMAYLVAALVAQIHDKGGSFLGHPVTITTSSIELQKMIMEREIPALSRMLEEFGIMNRPLRAVLRKGKEHYFCPRRYEDYISSIKNYPHKYSKTMEQLREYDLNFRGFDLDPLQLGPHIKSNICVQGSCKNCRYPGHCKYAEFIEYANLKYHFDFQITNHNLFLTYRKRLKTQPNAHTLQDSHFVIIDEAHKLVETATDIFGIVLDPKELLKFLESVKYTKKSTSADRRAYQNLLKETELLVLKLIAALAKTNVDRGEDVSMAKYQLSTFLEYLLNRIQDKLRQIEEMNRPFGRGDAPSAAKWIELLGSFGQGPGVRCWIKYLRESKSFLLCNIPYSTAAELQKYLWSNPNIHWGLTSGTMCDDAGFAFFKNEIGFGGFLDNNSIVEYRCDSPFDYANHTRLYISENVPAPDMDDPYYLPAICAEIINLVRATRGRTAVLFTSYKMLSAVFETVKPYLAEYPLIQMSRSNKNAIAQFKASGNGVLFASGSMWEGVDCAGDILSSVIIVRLPFPLRNQASEQKKTRCASVYDFVQAYAVPEMIIKLRQGAGRLIRTETDTGILAILDARAARGGAYRHRVLTALRKYPLVSSIFSVRGFIDNVKGESYKKGA